MIAMLKTYVSSDVGREYADSLRPADTLRDAETLLTQTTETNDVYRRTGSAVRIYRRTVGDCACISRFP